jgi:hypothetical protein
LWAVCEIRVWQQAVIRLLFRYSLVKEHSVFVQVQSCEGTLSILRFGRFYQQDLFDSTLKLEYNDLFI